MLTLSLIQQYIPLSLHPTNLCPCSYIACNSHILKFSSSTLFIMGNATDDGMGVGTARERESQREDIRNEKKTRPNKKINNGQTAHRPDGVNMCAAKIEKIQKKTGRKT